MSLGIVQASWQASEKTGTCLAVIECMSTWTGRLEVWKPVKKRLEKLGTLFYFDIFLEMFLSLNNYTNIFFFQFSCINTFCSVLDNFYFLIS